MATRKKTTTKKNWSGPDALKPFLVPIRSVRQDKENARVHDKRNIETIKRSLEKNGQVQVLVSYKKTLVAGNGRHEAARQLKWTHLAVLEVGQYFATKEQARAFALMDNKSSELASWDFEKVQSILVGMPTEWHDFTGFADFEIEPLMHGTFQPKEPGEMPKQEEGDEDGNKGVSFWATNAQATIIRRSIDKIKSDEEDENMSDGRALELICADYCAG